MNYDRMMGLPIPKILVDASRNPSLLKDYLLSPSHQWLQPYDPADIDWQSFDQDFDGKTETKEGLLVGAIRICNTGCEGYHVYVFRGPFKGTIWSDQRVPFGRLTQICDNIEDYIHRIEKRGKRHITDYESFASQAL